MNAWIYQAALYCDDCAGKMLLEDRDDYPQGPYPNGGGEADTPQHCDNCNLFLENPLTADGYDYVKERLKGQRLGPFTQRWAAFYDLA